MPIRGNELVANDPIGQVKGWLLKGMVDLRSWLKWKTLEQRALAIHVPAPVAPPGGPLPPPTTQFAGLGTVHDEFVRRLSEQSDIADKMDTKTGVLVALLAGAAGLATAGPADIFGKLPHGQTLLVVSLVLSLLCALASLWPRPWLKPPNPADYATYIHWTQEETYAEVMESFYAAIVINAQTMASKVRWLDWSFRLLVLGGLVFGIAVVSHLEHWLGN